MFQLKICTKQVVSKIVKREKSCKKNGLKAYHSLFWHTTQSRRCFSYTFEGGGERVPFSEEEVTIGKVP